MKRTSLTFLLLFASSLGLLAQSYTMSGIYKGFIRTGTIVENEEVRGYYSLYRLEKTSKGKIRYEVEILDENLELILKEDLVVDKQKAIMEVEYNGKAILFKFYDTKEKDITYYVINENSKIERGSRRDPDKNKIEMQQLEGLAKAEKGSFTLFAVGSEGFVDIHDYNYKMKGYEVVFLGNDGKVKWKYRPKADKGRRSLSYLTNSENDLIFTETYSKNVYGKDMQYNLLALSKEGDKKFNVPLVQDNYILSPQNAFINADNGNIVLIGEYYNMSKNIMKDPAEGIFLRGINEEGLWERDRQISYERDIKKTMSFEQLEELKKWKVYFHDIFRMNDGTIMVVGEQYKRSADAAKIVGAALSGGDPSQGLTKFRSGDMISITLDKDGNLNSFKTFPKFHRGTSLVGNIDFASIDYVAKLMHHYNGYDYVFTQFSADRSAVSITFDDKVTEEDGKGKEFVTHFQTYTVDDQSFTEDIFRYKSDATVSVVRRGKPGYLLIYEFFKKEKKAQLHLEPLNY
jgi:uncharacterized protein YegP (UPF0339 family)